MLGNASSKGFVQSNMHVLSVTDMLLDSLAIMDHNHSILQLHISIANYECHNCFVSSDYAISKISVVSFPDVLAALSIA